MAVPNLIVGEIVIYSLHTLSSLSKPHASASKLCEIVLQGDVRLTSTMKMNVCVTDSVTGLFNYNFYVLLSRLLLHRDLAQ